MTPTIETFINQAHLDLVPQFEARMRNLLVNQSKEWLIEQIIRLALDTPSLYELDRRHILEAKARQRAERIARLREMRLNPNYIQTFIEQFHLYDRPKLMRDGYLCEGAPIKGTVLIRAEQRTEKGEALLQQAKDMLFGLLFGDESTRTQFVRIQQELLTVTLPRAKAHALDFLKASTELNAAGTWQDPDSISNDSRADNIILEVEYGEVAGELIGIGIVRCLSLINNLEVNEQILYARMIDIEQSTLIE